MQPKLRHRLVQALCAIFAILGIMGSPAFAADVIKTNNTDNLDQPTSWVGNAVPTSADTGVWDATVLGANSVLLGSDASWLGLRIANPGGPVAIGAGNALTLGAGGIDLSAATQDLTLSNSVVFGANQPWTVGPGRVLTLSGAASGTGNLTKGGAGTLKLGGLDSYVGSTVINDGTVQLEAPTPTAATLPVTTGLRARFDASAIVGLTDGQQIATWNDTSGNGINATRTAGTAGYPMYKTNILNGRPVVRFAGDSSSYFSFTAQTNILAAFFVVKQSTARVGATFNFLLGDSSVFHFHRGDNDLLWSANTSANIRGGVTRKDGVAIDGLVTKLGTEWTVLDIVAIGPVTASRIAYDRTQANRSWDGDIAEVLLYTNALSVAEVQQVEEYLHAKWLQGPLPMRTDLNLAGSAAVLDLNGVTSFARSLSGVAGSQVSLAAGATLSLNSTNTNTFSGVLTGTGGLIKSGAGAFTLAGSAANTATGTTIIDNGNTYLAKTGGAYAISGPVQMGTAINANQANLRTLANYQFAPSTVMTFTNTTAGYSRFDLLGTVQQLAGIQSTTGGAVVQNEQLGSGGTTLPATLVLSNNAPASYSYNGYLRDRDSGAGIYPTTLIKNGTANQTFAGTSISHSGGTIINDGTLTVTGGGSAGGIGSGPLTINYPGTLITTVGDALGYGTADRWVRVLNLNNGLVNNTGGGNFGWGLTYYLNGGELRANGGVSSATAGSKFAFGQGTTLNVLPNATNAIISGRLDLRENNPNNLAVFNVADGAAADDLLVTAAITGSGANGFLKVGPGRMTLTSISNIFSSPVVVNQGTLGLSATGTLTNTPSITVGAAGTLDVALVNPWPLGQATTAIQGLQGSGTVNGNVSAGPKATVNPGTAGVAGTLTLNNDLTLTNVTLNYDLAATPAGISDLLQMSGGSTLTLLGTNRININPVAGLTNPFPAGTYTLAQGAGSIAGTTDNLALGSFNNSPIRPSLASFAVNPTTVTMTIGANPTLVWGGATNNAWDFSAYNWTNGGVPDVFYNLDPVLFDDTGATNLVNLVSNVTPSALTVNAAVNYTFYGANSLTGPFPITKQGSGALIISNSNAGYTGPVSVTAGMLQIGTGTNAGSLASAPVTVTSPAVLRYSRSDAATFVNPVSGNGTISFLGLNAPIRPNFSDHSIGGNNSGFTGQWIINGARFNATTSLTQPGAASLITVENYGQAFLGGLTYTNAFRLAGIGWQETAGNLGAIRFGNANAVVAGPITLTANARIAEWGNNGTITGPIDGNYELELFGGSAAATIFMACPANTTAATLVNGSLLYAQANTPSAFSTGPLTLTNGGNIRLNGFNLTFASLSGATGTVRNENTILGANSVLTVGTGNTSTGFGGTIISTSGGTLGLNKAGSGTLWLTNSANNYTGDTTISGGSLALVGSAALTGTPNILVASNAVLDVSLRTGGTYQIPLAGQAIGGSGSVTGTVITASGAISPGGPLTPGTLTFENDLVMGPGSVSYFNLTPSTVVGSDTNDLVVVNGNLETGSSTVYIRCGTNNLSLGTYRLFNYAGVLSNSFNPVVVFDRAAGGYLDYSVTNEISLVVTSYTGGASLVWAGNIDSSWDLNNTPNFAGSAKFYGGDAVTLSDLASNFTANVLGTLIPASVTVNSSSNYVLGGNGKLSGPTSLTKTGPGMLTLSTSGGNDYSGAVTVNNGILRLGNNTAWGNYAGQTFVTNTGTLDLNGVANLNGGEWVTISGTGLNNTGAVINTGGETQNGLRYLRLAGNATIAQWGSRWDVRGPGGSAGSFNATLDLGGYTLTKVGGGMFAMTDVVVTNTGSIQLQAGALSVTRSLITGPGSLLIGTNTLELWNATTAFYGDIAKPIVFDAGATLRVNNASYAISAVITNNGPITMDIANTFTLTNGIHGAGGFTKITSGNLQLFGPCTYSGDTILTAGTLTLGPSGSIANTPLLFVGSGCTFNATAVASYALPSNQTLAGSGTVAGVTSAGSSNTLLPGGQATFGTLSMTSPLTLTSAKLEFDLSANPVTVGGNVNDLLAVTGNLTLAGTSVIKLNPVGTLDTSRPYTIVTYTGSLTGSAANLSVITDSSYVFAVDASVPGQIRVTASGTAANLSWKGTAGNPTWWDIGTTANWDNGAGADVFQSGDNVTLDASASTYSLEIQTPLTVGSLTVNSANDYVIGGIAAYPASLNGYSLIKNGTGRLTLARTNIFATTVALNQGTLEIGNGLADGWLALPTPMTLPAGATLAYNRRDNLTVANQLIGGGSFLKRGVNTLTLSAGNGFAGGLTISSGTVSISSGTGAGSGVVTLGDANTGTNNVAFVSGSSLTIGNNFVVSSSGTGTATIGSTGGGLYNFNGSLAMNRSMTLQGLGTDRTTFNGPILGAGNLTIDAVGTGRRVTIGSNSFVGTTLIMPATILQLNSAGNTVLPDAYDVTVNGILQMNTTSTEEIIGGLQGTNAAAIIRNEATVTGTPTLAFGGGDLSGNYPGSIVNGSGTFNIRKAGAGTQTLSGTLSYLGNTTIDGGILRLVNTASMGTAGILLNSPGVLELSNSVATTFNRVITGNGGLVKAGPAAFSVTSTNPAFSGSVAVNAGTVNLTGDLGFPSAVTVAGGATLNGSGLLSSTTPVLVNNGATISALNYVPFTIGGAGLTLGTAPTDNTYANFSSDLSGVPGYIDLLGGTLSLTGTTTIAFSGALPQIPGSYPLIKYAATAGSGVVTNTPLPPGYLGYVTNDANALQVQLVIISSDTLLWVGAPINDWDLSTNKVWKLATTATPLAFVNGFVVGFDDTAANYLVNITTNVKPTTISVNAANNYTFQGTALEFGGILVKDGTGTLTLSNQVSAVGLQMDDGRLIAVANNTFTNLTFNDGILQLGNGGSTGWVPLPAALNLPTTTSGLVLNRSDVVTLSTVLSGDGSFTQAGPGTLITSGAHSYAGDTTISGGTLKLGVANLIPDGAGKGNLIVEGRLDLNAFAERVNGLSGSGTVDTLAGGNITFTVGSNDVSSTFAGTLKNTAGSLALQKVGLGELTLTGTNTHSGTISVDDGSLVFNGGRWLSGAAAGSRSLTVGNGQNRLCIITNGAVINIGGWASLGYLANAAGSTLILDSGSLTIGGLSGGSPPDRCLVVGEYAGSTSQLTQNGGALNVANALWIGQTAGGTWDMNGGTANMAKLGIAQLSTSSGTVNINDGIVTIGAGGIETGAGLSRTLILNGGALASSAPWATAQPMTINGAGVGFDTTGGSITINGAIDGPGGLIKSGPNTLTLASSFHSGSTVVNGGILSVPAGLPSTTFVTVNPGAELRGAGTVSAFGGIVIVADQAALSAPNNALMSIDNLTLGASSSDNMTLNFSANGSAIAGRFDITAFNGFSVAGTNVVNVTGSLPMTVPSTNTLITYQGALNGTCTWKVGSLPGRNAGGYVLDTGTQIVLVVTNMDAVYWVGDPANNWDLTGVNVWRLANNTPTGFTNSDIAIFNDTASNLTVNVGVNVSPANVLLDTTNTYTLSGAGGITGGATLLKLSTGTAILTGPNSYTGGTTISNGTLQIGNALANGSIGTGTYAVSSDARLYLNYATATPAGAGLWSSKVSGSGTLELRSAQGANGAANWGPNSATAVPFDPSFTGTLKLDNGRMDFSPTGGGGITNLIIESGAQFLAWSGTYLMPAYIAGTGWGEAGQPMALRLAGSQTGSWEGNVTLTADSGIMAQSGSTFTIGGSITGPYLCEFYTGAGGSASTLNVTPSATVQNSYGSTRVNATSNLGTVVAGNQYAFSTGPLQMVGGTLKLNGFSFNFASLSGTGGSIQNGDPATLSLMTVGADGTTNTYAGTLVNGSTAPLALTKVGTGALTLTAQNTHSGGTIVDGGAIYAWGPNSANGALGGGNVTVNTNATIFIGNDNSFVGAPTSAAKTITVNPGGLITNAGNSTVHMHALVMNGGTLGGTTPNMTYGNYNFDHGVSTPGNGSASLFIGGNAALIQAGGNVFNIGTNDTLTVAMALDHVSYTGFPDTGLIKTGAGNMFLQVANTYTGPTVVNDGILYVNGSLAAASAVSVAAGGTLGGTGLISGSVSSLGTISPGLSIGTLTVGGTATLGGTTYMEIDRAAVPNCDKLSAGTVVYGGTLVVTNLGAAPQLGDAFQLFPAGSYSGTFAAMVLPTLDTGWAWNWNSATGTLTVVDAVNTTPINIGYSLSGTNLTLNWPADHTGWRLLSQTNALSVGLTSTWYDVAGSTTTNVMTFPVDPTKPTVFYRLVYP